MGDIYTYEIKIDQRDLTELDNAVRAIEKIGDLDFEDIEVDFDMTEIKGRFQNFEDRIYDLVSDLELTWQEIISEGFNKELVAELTEKIENMETGGGASDAGSKFLERLDTINPNKFLTELFDEGLFGEQTERLESFDKDFVNNLEQQLGKAFGQGNFDFGKFQSMVESLRDQLSPELLQAVRDITEDNQENIGRWLDSDYTTRNNKSMTKGGRLEQIQSRMPSHEEYLSGIRNSMERLGFPVSALENDDFSLDEWLDKNYKGELVSQNIKDNYNKYQRRKAWEQNDKKELKSLMKDLSTTLTDPILDKIEDQFGQVSESLAKEMKSIFSESFGKRGNLMGEDVLGSIGDRETFIDVVDEIFNSIAGSTAYGFGSSAMPTDSKLNEIFLDLKGEVMKLAENITSGNLVENIDKLTNSPFFSKELSKYQSDETKSMAQKMREYREQKDLKKAKGLGATPQFMTEELKSIGQKIETMDSTVANAVKDSIGGLSSKIDKLTTEISGLRDKVIKAI